MNKKDTVNWAILGCGVIAKKLGDALSVVPNARKYAAGSRNLSRASEFAEEFGFEKAYGSYMELVRDPEIDIVYVATPHSYHFAHTKLCLENGKHVLCEKPFTVNAKQSEYLVKLAREKKLFLMEALWSRFLPHIIKAKEVIESGIIGDPVSMDADFGVRFEFDPEFRLFNPLLAGGALLDLGIYPLFLSTYLFGFPEKLTSHARLHDNKVDLVTSVITESNSGVICNLQTSGIVNTPIEATIYGTNGSLKLNRMWFAPSSLTLQVENRKKETIDFPVDRNGYEYEAKECTKCILDGKIESSLYPLNNSLKMMDLLDQIRTQTGISYPAEIESLDKPYGLDEL